jgi:gentisate 1,2-dioxygenase
MPDATVHHDIRRGELLSRFAAATTLEELGRAIEPLKVVPGWGPGSHSSGPDPVSPFKTWHWSYEECRAALEAASRMISAEDAGRRTLLFRNPVPDLRIGAARTMLHAYQLIMPGERASSHRHTPHALRVILDGKKMYSIVDGEKTLMETGDVVLTPGGSWHSHEHDGDETACWIDGLDVPLVAALNLQTFQPHPDRYETVERVVEETPYRFSAASIQRRLDAAPPDPEGYFARRVLLEAPSMPTLGLYVYRLEGRRATRRYRTNANVSFCVMEGSGTSVVDGTEIHWEHGDIFIVPSWRWIEHRPDADSQLFSMTDEPLLRFARYYRFEGE